MAISVVNIVVKVVATQVAKRFFSVWALALILVPLSSQAEEANEPAAEEPVVAPELKPLEIHPRTSLTVVEQLRYNHYVKKQLDDGISSDVFDKYLDNLDGGRAYFLASDVEEFEDYRYTLDDALKRGNLDPAYVIFNRYQTRAVERLQFLGAGQPSLDQNGICS